VRLKLRLQCSDYREDSARDRYDLANIDDEDYETMDAAERAAVEQRLNRRDAEVLRREGRMADAFMDGIDDEVDNAIPTRRRHRRLYDADMGMNLDDENTAVVRFNTLP
jgi:DNA replication licensing factor MCM2